MGPGRSTRSARSHAPKGWEPLVVAAVTGTDVEATNALRAWGAEKPHRLGDILETRAIGKME